MVILLVNAYMLIDGDIVGECTYVGELMLNLCIVCHRFMHHMLSDIDESIISQLLVFFI